MKKLVVISVLLLFLSCTKETTIYIENANFNKLTDLEIDNIDSVGPVKLNIITKELQKGEFKSKKDFDERMKDKLSDELRTKIIKTHKFETTNGGT